MGWCGVGWGGVGWGGGLEGREGHLARGSPTRVQRGGSKVRSHHTVVPDVHPAVTAGGRTATHSTHPGQDVRQRVLPQHLARVNSSA